MSQETHDLWTEKYRPNSTKKVVLPPKVRTFFNKIISTKILPNLILYYPKPGNGKTSLAKAICHDLELEDSSDIMYINASQSANIDLLRNDITDFASVWSIDNKIKVVILDEMENSTTAFQNALKVFSEVYSEA